MYDPRQGFDWLRRGTGVSVLRSLTTGELPISHKALDEIVGEKRGRATAVEHVRTLLVGTGALPARDEPLSRLERTIDLTVARAHPLDQQVLDAFARWHVLAGARRRISRGSQSRGVCLGAALDVSVASRFLAWLRTEGISPTAIPQEKIDHWAREHAGHTIDLATFLRWTGKRGMTSGGHVHRPPRADPRAFTEAEQHYELAQRCLSDDTMPPRDPLIVGLVVLYAQPLRAVSQLRRADVVSIDAGTTVRLGREPVVLMEPLGEIARDAASSPIHPGSVVRAGGRPTPWLFPGAAPERPANAESLRRRLHGYGVESRAARQTALLNLARDVPNGVLADLLGIDDSTAEQWRVLAGSQWVAYAGRGGTSGRGAT